MSSKSSTTPGQSPNPGGMPLRSLIRAARGVFSRPVRIEREQSKPRAALEEGSGAAQGKAQEHRADVAPETQATLMRSDLKAHLDRCGNSRAALPHLATLEHELKKRGMRVFSQLPLKVLQRAAAQLDGLAQEPLLEGFTLLQARLATTIVAREESAQVQIKLREPSPFLMEHKLQVSEASMSDFMLAGGDLAADPSAAPDHKPG